MVNSRQTIDEKIYKERLSEQALAYLVAGVLVSISHHFHTYSFIVFWGHFLIAISLILLASTLFKYEWARYISTPFSVFGGTTLIITFAVDLAIFFVDELQTYKEKNIVPQNLIDPLFITIVLAVAIWVVILSIPLIVPLFKKHQAFKIKFPSLFFVLALVLIVVIQLTKIMLLQNFLMIICSCFMLTIVILYKDKFPNKKELFLSSSNSFLVFIPAFLVSSALAYFSKATSWRLFLLLALISFFLLLICVLFIDDWRKRVIEFTKSLALLLRFYLLFAALSLVYLILCLLDTMFGILKKALLRLKIYLSKSNEELSEKKLQH